MSYHHINNNLNKARGVDADFDWLVMNYFSEFVNNNKDWIIAVFLLIRQN